MPRHRFILSILNYSSICFPKNDEAVSASFISNSLNFFPPSFDTIITAPTVSPSAIIGDITCAEYFSSISSSSYIETALLSSPK